MKNIIIFVLTIASTSLFAANTINLGNGGSTSFITQGGDEVQVTCKARGGHGGRSNCACEPTKYSSSDWDFKLIFTDSSGSKQELGSWSASDSNYGKDDAANCEAEKNNNHLCRL
jgi:hypothetical protein